MASERKLTLTVVGDTKALERALSSGRKASESTFDKVAKGAKVAGMAITAFGVASAAVLFSSVKDWQASERAAVEMQNTIKNMPKLAGANIKSFKELASSIQSYSAAEDDTVLSGMAMLGTFSLTEKQIKGITPLVVDYARKFGLEIPQASIQVGKALDGQIGALKRNGVSIDETMFKTDKYGAVQKALREQVGGFARDEAESGIAALERMGNALGDVKEVMGGVVADTLTPLVMAFQKWFTELNKTNPAMIETATRAAMITTGLALVIGPMMIVIGHLPKIAKGFQLVGISSWAAAGRLGAVVGVVTVLGHAFYDTQKAERSFMDERRKNLREHGFFIGVLENTKNSFQNLASTLTFGYIPKSYEAGRAVDSHKEAQKEMAEVTEQVSQTIQAEMEETTNAVKEKTIASIQGMGLEQAALDSLTQAISIASDEQITAFDQAKESYRTWVGLFEETPEKVAITGAELTKRLQEQVARFNEWRANIQALTGRVPPEMLAELMKMGPAAAGEIQTLKGMTDQQLAEYVELWRQKNAQAIQAAKDGIKEGTPALVAQVDRTGMEVIHHLGQILPHADKSGFSIGLSWTKGIASGIDGTLGAVDKALERAKRRLQGGSPPPEGPLKNVDIGGYNIGKSWVEGINEGIRAATTTGVNLVANTLSGGGSRNTTLSFAGANFNFGGDGRKAAGDFMTELQRLTQNANLLGRS